MSVRLLSFIAAISLTAIVSSNAAPIPAISVGDAFTVHVTINPPQPCTQFCNPPFIEYLNGNFGQAEIIAGDLDVLAPVTFLRVQYESFITPPLSQWFVEGGDTVGFWIQLLGHSPFSSIDPLPLSSYQSATFNFNITGSSTIFSYEANVTSIGQAAANDYLFSGVITSTGQVTLGAVPEPSTWLLMLAGFGVISLAGKRLRRSASTDVQPGCC